MQYLFAIKTTSKILLTYFLMNDLSKCHNTSPLTWFIIIFSNCDVLLTRYYLFAIKTKATNKMLETGFLMNNSTKCHNISPLMRFIFSLINLRERHKSKWQESLHKLRAQIGKESKKGSSKSASQSVCTN